MILLVAAYNLDIEWIIKKTMHCQISMLLLTVGSAFLGIIPNVQNVSYAGGFMRHRECLGYTYTTFAPNFLLSIAIEWLYLSRNNSKKKIIIQSLIITLINIVFYKKTGTRTSFALVFVIIIIKMLSVLKIPCIIKHNFFIRNIFVILSITSVGLSFFYNPSIKWMASLNNLLSQRLRFAQEGLVKWGISSLGTSVIWNSNATTYNYIDSSYVNILICYGIIVFCVVILGFSITMRYACKANNKELILALVIWAIRAFVDPQLYLLWFNPFMFYSGSAVIMQLKNNKKKITKVENKNVVNYMRI